VKLSAGADAAWSIAAGEASASGHEKIEPLHLLIGVLSLDKLSQAVASGVVPLEPAVAVLIRDEEAGIRRALQAVGTDAPLCRRQARERLGRGSRAGAPPGPLGRSPVTKAVFAAAEAFAAERDAVSAAHLLASLADAPDPATHSLFAKGGLDGRVLHEAALREAGGGARDEGEQIAAVVARGLAALMEGARRDHDVTLIVEAKAERFVVDSASKEGRGAPGAHRALERLVERPLSALGLSGKLGKHRAWRVVYDEGGIYLLPEPESRSAS
jgi:ATP-dependent Clp protease ATP-binding subunit ClpA